MFVDDIDSADDILWNSSAQANNYLDIWNGTGVLKDGDGSADVIAAFNKPNARRFTITGFMLQNFWADLKTQPGLHTVHVVAKMEDGTLIVVADFEIEVVDHECM